MAQTPQRGLGRGFDALIPTQVVDPEFDPTAQPAGADSVHQLPVGTVKPNPHQPRLTFDEAALAQLADSVRVHGILQPLVVTKVADGYELIAGERRLRAAKLANLETVPAIVRSFDDQQKLELALIENLQREELNPIETATAYRKLIDQFNLSQDDIATRVGRDKSTVSNTMRLLNLPLDAKRAIVEGKITEGHGRVILSVVDADKQATVLDMILQNNWSVREAEAFARHFKHKQATAPNALVKAAPVNPLTQRLSEYLGAKVNLKQMAKGKGQLIIEYYSKEELQRIYDAIRRDQD
jgi:ParB family chromosome partitioning protein